MPIPLLFPRAECGGEPQVEIFGRSRLVADGVTGVLSYDACYARLKTRSFILAVTGESLLLDFLTPTSVALSGRIRLLEWED